MTGVTESQLVNVLRRNVPQLRQLTPGHGSLDFDLIIREVAAAARRRPARSWQDAWNDVSGATPTRPGLIRFWAHVRCPRCHGKQIDMRTARACTECVGRGRVHTNIRQIALWAEPPAEQEEPSDA